MRAIKKLRLIAITTALAAIAALQTTATQSSASTDEKIKPPGPGISDSWLSSATEQQKDIYHKQREISEKIAPHKALASAANAVGKTQIQEIFSGVEISDDLKTVNLYLTDISRAQQFLTAMNQIKSGLQFDLLSVRQGKNTRIEAEAETRKFLKEAKDGKLPFTIYGASWTADGGTIKADVDSPSMVEQYKANTRLPGSTTASVSPKFDIFAQQGQPIEKKTRENDYAPFYGGAALGIYDLVRAHCTSGIPVRGQDGHLWMVTAGHCYPINEDVYAHGGNYVGRVAINNAQFDVAFIDTPSAAWTWDGLDPNGYVRELAWWEYSSNGDYVCQLGYNSMVAEQRIPCNNKVTDSEYYYYFSGGDTIEKKGVKAVQQNGVIATVGGDSGATVVSFVDGSEARIVHGFVSGGTGTTLVYMDMQDIANGFHVDLAY